MSETQGTKESLLEKKYVYQNNKTGTVSQAPLTTRQLCKSLCPKSGVVLSHITPETQVLGVEENGSFDPSGWNCAKSISVLQEACAQWYYAKGDGEQPQGPLTCRQLSDFLTEKTITSETKVWSSHLSSWESIEKLPNLSAALEAFAPDTALPSTTTLNEDPATMTFDNEVNQGHSPNEKQVQDELEAFLHSTDHLGPQHHNAADDDDIDEGYVSDHGTPYVKDPTTGNWIHADLAPKKPSVTTNNSKRKEPATQATTKKRNKKPKFSAKNAKCWIYITGLPHDTNEEELLKFCAKVGILELDPETQRPKIKLYREKTSGKIKGDASVCFARPESVQLALQLLDEAPYRPETSVTEYKVSVTRAKFEQHGDVFQTKKVSNAKRKVAKLAALQAIGWDEGDNGRITGGRKGLRIIVLKHMFTLEELKENEDQVLSKLEHEIRKECDEWGTVEKLTVFSKNKEGVIIVKFKEPTAASTAISEFHGRQHNGRRIECIFWDGVTDYTVRDEEQERRETEKRQEEFGQWLDNQDDLPEELRLQTES